MIKVIAIRPTNHNRLLLDGTKKILIICFFLIAISCNSKYSKAPKIIGFSQAMTTDNWRREMDRTMELEASLHHNIKLETRDAQNNVNKQITQIDDFINQNVDVLLVSPIKSTPLTPIIEKAMAKGIPTIIIDRKIEGNNFTAYVGANNVKIGRIAAKYMLSHAKHPIKIVEITGLLGSSPARERKRGFSEALDLKNNTEIVATIHGDWEKASIKSKLNKLLDSISPPDYIFAQNDRMGLGAWEVARSKSLEDRIKIIGVDGVFGPNGGMQFVKDKILSATILYPTGGAEAIKLAVRLINKETIQKNNILNTVVIDSVNVDIMQNQFTKMNQQQNDIERQQSVIKEQIATFNSQSNLIRLMVILLILLILLSVWSIYSVFKIKKSKRRLELNNKKIIIQRNQIKSFAEKLKESNESKINFFMSLSHEFKTPLTLITSSIESISENERFKDFSYETNLIINNSQRLLRLINELLGFRKLENEVYELRPVKTNLYEFVKNIYGDFKIEASKKSISLSLKTFDKGIEVYMDRSMMDKVVFNLFSNAFKFTPKNGKISILIENLPENQVMFKIKDSGIGIPQEDFFKIFDPFLQANNNTNPSSGLGLYIAKKFVELHKGKISVSSQHGAEFKIILLKGKAHLKEFDPVDDFTDKPYENMQVLKELVENGEEEWHETNNEHAESILIIEDNTDLAHLLGRKLGVNYNVIFSDGTDGLKKALEIIPDVILCDLNLPEKSGFEICEGLKNDLRTSHIPTIILTALDNIESRIKALKAGADSYITKPFNFEILEQSIRAALYNREKLRYYYTNRINQVNEENFKNREQLFLKELNTLIDKHLGESNFSVEELAQMMRISRIQLYRKVKAILDISISDFINNKRLDRAKSLLQESDLNIAEIAYSVGYSSPGYFSTSFKNKYGFSPNKIKG